MPQPVSQIITEAFQKIGVVDETQSPAAEQASNGLTVLNDMLANEEADGLYIGWYRQSDPTQLAPIRDSDYFAVKLMLAMVLAPLYGINMAQSNPMLVEAAAEAKRQLTKRAIRYFESDLGELSRAQGAPWGGLGYFV